jgi:hypothetical protein
MNSHLGLRANHQPIAHLRLRSVNGVRRQFQHAGRLSSNRGNPKSAEMLDEMYDPQLFVEVYEVDRKEHADRVDAARWNHPDPIVGSQPQLSYQTLEPRE